MTPLCKVEVTLPRVLGSREVRCGGGVDEARFHNEIRQARNCMTTAGKRGGRSKKGSELNRASGCRPFVSAWLTRSRKSAGSEPALPGRGSVALKSGRPIGRARIDPKVEEAGIRVSLASGKGVLKTAREMKVGSGTVQRVKAAMMR